MTTKMKIISVSIIVGLIAYFLGYTNGIGNQIATYGDTGFPKNCRALISKNIEGYNNRSFTADEALGSINRNCGMYGLIWYER